MNIRQFSQKVARRLDIRKKYSFSRRKELLEMVFTPLNTHIFTLVCKKNSEESPQPIKNTDILYFESFDELLHIDTEYILFMLNGDKLFKNAFYETEKAAKENKADIIYCDEERGGVFLSPFFKPDFSPDTLLSFNYMGNFFALKTEIFRSCHPENINSFYGILLEATRRTKNIYHIPKTLFKAVKKEDMGLQKKDLARHLSYFGESVVLKEKGQGFSLNYIIKDLPRLSIIIPSKDNPEVLERCLLSLSKRCETKYEIIICDNGSSEENRLKYEKYAKDAKAEYIYFKEDFNFSKMCNRGAENSGGEYLLFLNDDTEAVTKGFDTLMLSKAMASHVGAVGAKLLYPHTDRIQHCGVLNFPNGPVHALMGKKDSKDRYFSRNLLTYNYIAVTGACLMTNRHKFENAGRFKEALTVAYNDVELCFCYIEEGFYNCVVNDALLYHYESFSRGNDLKDPAKLKRLAKERNTLYTLHPNFKNKDPFYNINLTQRKTDFSPVS